MAIYLGENKVDGGGGTVTDVQVNGTSVVNNGVANITGGSGGTKVWYGTTTSKDTVKDVTCSGFSLNTGDIIYVHHTYSNNRVQPCLNINNTGAIPISFNGYCPTSSESFSFQSGAIAYRYNGTSFDIVSPLVYRAIMYQGNGSYTIPANGVGKLSLESFKAPIWATKALIDSYFLYDENEDEYSSLYLLFSDVSVVSGQTYASLNLLNTSSSPITITSSADCGAQVVFYRG